MHTLSAVRGRWLYPLLGGALGFLYVLLDEGVLDHLPADSSALVAISHELLDGALPIFLGIATGAGVYLLARHRQLIRRLSLKNESLQNDVLFHTLVSQMLHEIRNPLHAIRAALENPDALDAEERKQLILRNLDRVSSLKESYEARESVFDRLNAREPVRVDTWFESLFEDKIDTRLRESGIRFSKRIEPVTLAIHPLLLEQVLLTLFSNAIEAASEASGSERHIALEVSAAPDGSGAVRLSNGGAPFPETALASQGDRPVPSKHGHGLGLLLARKLLEQAGARLRLSNEDGKAVVTLWIPRHA